MKLSIFIIFGCISLICGEDYLIADPIKSENLQTWFANIYGYENHTFEVSGAPNGIYSTAEKDLLIERLHNDFEFNSSKWIAYEKWRFSYEISDDDFLSRNNVILVFDGIDTIAEILFNNVSIGTTNNMFVQQIFDVKDYIQEGVNTVDILIDSPLESAMSAYIVQNSSYSIPRECPPAIYNGDCHINMLRKMQASFSSSFGPSAPSEGIWRPAYLLGYKESYIKHVVTQVENLNETYWRINIQAHLAKNRNDEHIYGRINLILNGTSLGTQGYWWLDVTSNEYGEYIWEYPLDIEKETVDLWWPNGYGKQPLYNLTVQYYSSDLREGDQKTIRIGFRTVELVQDEIGDGLSFYFKINDVPIFIKGSNVVPLDILPEYSEDKPTIRKLIKDAVDSSMNMLRIWGGGNYAADYLYELADQSGILIWQEFMFAGSLYPANEDFLNNVVAEVRYQAKRLYNHPSLALFSGNSRIEQALAENWFDLEDQTQYRADYLELFGNAIQNELARVTRDDAIYVLSSPSNGLRSEIDGYISANPNDELFGDTHYFNDIDDPFDVTKYPVPRFASAFGLQSLPSTESLLNEMTNNYYLDVNKEWLIFRQHHSDGYEEMQALIETNFVLPNANESFYFFAYVYYSQVTQGHALKLQIEHYRRHKSSSNSEGKGLTMGAMYWHMNDVWSAPTSSGIDYYGRWKVGQYLVKNSFAPVIVTGEIIGSELNVHVVSDLLNPIYDATIKIQTFRWDSWDVVDEIEAQIDVIQPNTAETLVTGDLDQISADADCTGQTCFFFYLILEKDGDLIAPVNHVFPAPLKDCPLAIHYIGVQSVKKLDYQNIYEVVIAAENIAAFVYLDAHDIDGKFSDNGFLMVTPTKTVYFYSENDYYTEDDMLKMISVTHIRNSQYGFDNN